LQNKPQTRITKQKKQKQKSEQKKHKTIFFLNPKNETKNGLLKKASLCSKLLTPNLQEGRVGGNTSYYIEEQHKE
jgi:hypothetical protein